MASCAATPCIASRSATSSVIAISLPWLVWQEKPVNVQALAWIGAAMLLVCALYRSARLDTIKSPAVFASAAALP